MADQAWDKESTEELRKRFVYKERLVWDALDENERRNTLAYGERYKHFLDEARTEREAVTFIDGAARKLGFGALEERGAGYIFVNQHKSIALVRRGRGPLSEGFRLIASHIDCPRLDLKQKPVFEAAQMAYLDTHYYGGIKKYQWVSRPLAIHGTIIREGGERLNISIGSSPDDPVFTICDLLPHLAYKVQADKKLSEAIEGEKLNILAGSLPLGSEEARERVKLGLLHLLHERYGLIEEDFLSAELEAVPAEPARDVGLDRSLVGAYGQDDRACAYAALEALLADTDPRLWAAGFFLDKEEIGSDGATGAKSRFLETVVLALLADNGLATGPADVYRLLGKSRCISADVAGAMDPHWKEVYEERNVARLGYGPCISKYTGSRGKYGASDASAEFLGWLRRTLNAAGTIWQTGELGKVDEGGGGTVAKDLAVYGMEIIDMGTPVLSMHSPFEVASKADLYMTYKVLRAFLEAD
ncbi:MAG: aminopeptidase [Pseudomonadota bacterium]